jgi:hypothetical protein
MFTHRLEYRLWRRRRRRRRIILALTAILLLAAVLHTGKGHAPHRGKKAASAHITRGRQPATRIRARISGNGKSPTESTGAAGVGLSWADFHGIELPYSATDGPRHTRNGLAWGFTDTPRGALLAAVNIAVRAAALWYRRQPPERREKISKVAGQIGSHLLNEYEKATDGVHQARLPLRACAVPKPEQRSTLSAILRELAMSPESLSAEQLAELLAPPLRPKVADLRAFLRNYDNTMFEQVRRGGFVLGSHYELPD